MTGTQFTPADFTGGIKSKCVKLLIEQGFHIHQDKAAAATIADVLFPDELPSQETYVEGAAIKQSNITDASATYAALIW